MNQSAARRWAARGPCVAPGEEPTERKHSERCNGNSSPLERARSIQR